MEEDSLNQLVKDNTFYSDTSFELFIEKNKWRFDNSYLDVIINYCEENSIEPEDIVSHLSQTLILKIKAEANKNRLLKEKIRETNFDLIFEK